MSLCRFVSGTAGYIELIKVKCPDFRLGEALDGVSTGELWILSSGKVVAHILQRHLRGAASSAEVSCLQYYDVLIYGFIEGRIHSKVQWLRLPRCVRRYFICIFSSLSQCFYTIKGYLGCRIIDQQHLTPIFCHAAHSIEELYTPPGKTIAVYATDFRPCLQQRTSLQYMVCYLDNSGAIRELKSAKWKHIPLKDLQWNRSIAYLVHSGQNSHAF